MSSHSLEHVPDIFNDFNIIVDKLKPNGFLFFEVPNANSIYFNNYITDIPHTYFFNLESVNKLASYYNLKIIDIGEFGPNKKEYLDNNNFTIEEKNIKKPNGGNLRCLFQKSVNI